MPGNLPSLKITVAGIDLTYEAENITWSSIDPGGYEMATFDVQSNKANLIYPGDKILITDGLQTVFVGRIAEPAKMLKHGWGVNRRVGSANTRISAEGAGAALKDNEMSMIYIDRDLSKWQSWTVGRQLALTPNFNTSQFSWQVGTDTSGGNPGLVIQATGQLTGKPIIEMWYDAGPFNAISRIRVGAGQALSYTFPDALNILNVFTAQDTGAAVFSSGLGFPGATPSADYTTTTKYRYALIQHWYNTAAASLVAGNTYGYVLWNVSVIGNHGMALRGASSAVDGFYTSDIASHAVGQAIAAGAKLRIGQVDTLTNFIVQDYTQYTPIPHEQIVQDMARLAAAHYGVWESSSLLDDTPEFVFRAYSTDADYFTSLADCNEADLSERLSDLYTTANITYSDAAGVSFVTSVSLPNYLLDRVGIGRTTTVDLGLSTATVAQIFANFVLQILLAQSRSAGTIELPKGVRDRQGAIVPSYRLKAGIHRLRVSDLPPRLGLILSSDKDSFHISRIESNIDTTSGEVTTRVELDNGPNLIETLQAQLQIARQIVGY